MVQAQKQGMINCMLVEMINNNFGSKKGLFNSAKFKLLFYLGVYRKYQKIDFKRVKHLVFICSGNICRSALAEFVAKSLGLSSESFGLYCRGGDGADLRAIKFASKHGIDMSTHKTRNIKEYVAKNGDLMVAMEPAHIIKLEELGFSQHQITTLPVWAIGNIYLHDPYNTSFCFFEYCEEVVLAGVANLEEQLSHVW